MRVLAFRHVPFEGLGRIEAVLAARGIGFDYADLYQAGTPLPPLDDYAGLIFMGGPMSVNDPLPYIEVETRAIAQAIARAQPVLGVCLGAQLIARALGARVYRNPVPEIGWFDVRRTTAADGDAVFESFRPAEAVFHWHGDTFDLPAGAEWLAYSDACRHQAFRYGSNVYAMQFHLEVTPEMIAGWCREDENCGDVRELDGPIDPEHNAARLATLAEQAFGRWCDLLPGSA
jgi:GMP synthase-like glutamine amidotransferase